MTKLLFNHMNSSHNVEKKPDPKECILSASIWVYYCIYVKASTPISAERGQNSDYLSDRDIDWKEYKRVYWGAGNKYSILNWMIVTWVCTNIKRIKLLHGDLCALLCISYTSFNFKREGKFHICKPKNLDNRVSWFSKCSQLHTFLKSISLYNTLYSTFSAMKSTKPKYSNKMNLDSDLQIIDFNSKTLFVLLNVKLKK